MNTTSTSGIIQKNPNQQNRLQTNKDQPGQDSITIIKSASKFFLLGGRTVTALLNLSLSIKQGEFLVILGPSGSGKTTLLNLIGGLDNPSEGSVEFMGQDISRLSSKKLTRFRLEHIGFVFQFFNLFPTLTATENVSLPLELKGVPIKKARKQSVKILSEMGLAGRTDYFPDEMSGGEQQRVAIARALITDAPLILCDEPTGDLDFVSGRETLALMRRLNSEKGKTFVIVTHNSSIGQIADRIVHLRDGSITEIEVNPKPKDPLEITW